MFGLYLAVYFKRRVALKIPPKSFVACKVAAGGLLGGLSNKGAVAIRFEVEMPDGTGRQSIIAVNCHLTSGEDQDKNRLW